MERAVTWEGIFNARDLGGIPLPGGRRTAFGRIFRTGRVERLTDLGWQQMYDAGVRTLVDLRNPNERSRRATDPVVDGAIRDRMAVLCRPTEDQGDPEFMALCGPYLNTPEYYRYNLQRWPEKFAAVIGAIAHAGEGAVVVHCSAGRDRSGIIAMLLLRLVGAEPADVADDYELAVRAMNDYHRTQPVPREQPRSEEELQRWVDHTRAELLQAMDGFDVERYLLEAGAAAGELAAVRARLLE